MHRKKLLQALDEYEQTWASGMALHSSFDRQEEESALQKTREFVREFDRCFDRTFTQGHITGAAIVMNPTLDQTLLTLHAKLGLWLQLGGHSDGDPLTPSVAMREAVEESGLEELSFLSYEKVFGPGITSPLILDLDVHTIPARKTEPEHLHYDVRYLIIARAPEKIALSSESTALAWHPTGKVVELGCGRSLLRPLDKVRYVRRKLGFGP